MTATKTAAPTQFTMADLVKVIQADNGGRHGSIRRAMSALSALGIAPQLPASELSDADLFTGIVAPVHFYAPHLDADGNGYLSACNAAGKVLRTGRKVTCEDCKAIHRAAVADSAPEYSGTEDYPGGKDYSETDSEE